MCGHVSVVLYTVARKVVDMLCGHLYISAMSTDRSIEILSPAEQVVEQEQGRPVRELLADLYGQGLTQEQIADRLGVARGTVIAWMTKYGIRTRGIFGRNR